MRDWILADMRERRVGVTARSRQIEGNQATGSLQIASEIAAPLELRTPTSTAAKAAKQSADGSVANHGAGVNGGRRPIRREFAGEPRAGGAGTARKSRA